MEVKRQHFDFDLQSKFEPKGDQVRAINELTEGINKGEKYQTLLGATGTGKMCIRDSNWLKPLIKDYHTDSLLKYLFKTVITNFYYSFVLFYSFYPYLLRK